MEKTTMKLASDVEALVYKGGIAHTVTVEAGLNANLYARPRHIM
jgi:hypothetical protein